MSVDALAEEYWQLNMESSPVWATMVGDRRFDARMPDPSREGDRAHRARLAGLRDRAEAVAEEGLTPGEVLTRGELLGAIGRDLDALDADLDAFNVSAMGGAQVFLMQIPGLHPVRDDAELAGYAGRVEAMVPYLDGVVARFREGLGAGKVAFAGAAQRVLGQVEGLLEKGPAAWPLAAHVEDAPEGVSEPARAEARTRVAAASEALAGALGRFRDLLVDEILPAARGEDAPGLCHLEGGSAAYDLLRRKHTSLDLSTEEIHEIGKTEVARLRAAIEELGGRALDGADFAGIQSRLQDDPALFFDSREAIVAACEGAIRRAEDVLPDAFGRLRPAESCRVEPIPGNEEKDSSIGYYRGPSPDGSRPGTYFVNTYAPETRSRVDNEPLAFHEAVPGHHLQISIAQELGDLPAFRRHGGVTSYIEGWALYAERLSEELGLYSGDLDRLGALFFDIKRACRLVIDTGLHGLGWSREEGCAYLRENSRMHGHAVGVEIDRYVVMPGQALSYKLGQLEILRLRDRAKEGLGDAFTLGAFHDRVLEAGAVSLGVLGRRVEEWVAAGA